MMQFFRTADKSLDVRNKGSEKDERYVETLRQKQGFYLKARTVGHHEREKYKRDRNLNIQLARININKRT